jgi:hypothetical protein
VLDVVQRPLPSAALAVRQLFLAENRRLGIECPSPLCYDISHRVDLVVAPDGKEAGALPLREMVWIVVLRTNTAIALDERGAWQSPVIGK